MVGGTDAGMASGNAPEAILEGVAQFLVLDQPKEKAPLWRGPE